MKNTLFKNSVIAALALTINGCGGLLTPDTGSTPNSSNGLIPPSAQNNARIAPPVYPPMPSYNNQTPNILPQQSTRPQHINTMIVDRVEVTGSKNPEPKVERDEVISKKSQDPAILANSPMLTETNIIELEAMGMGIPPENTISQGQAMALAKRAAIVDAYRQLGEKMYGIRLNAQDTIKDMVVQSSTVKTKVHALIRNAEIGESIWKDGVMQVGIQLKLDGRIWYKVLTGAR